MAFMHRLNRTVRMVFVLLVVAAAGPVSVAYAKDAKPYEIVTVPTVLRQTMDADSYKHLTLPTSHVRCSSRW